MERHLCRERVASSHAAQLPIRFETTPRGYWLEHLLTLEISAAATSETQMVRFL
jgi:hypothetical protein